MTNALIWVWSEDARYRDCFNVVREQKQKFEAQLPLDGGGSVRVILSERFIEELVDEDGLSTELGLAVLAELKEMVVRYESVDLDHSVLLDEAVLFHGDEPCEATEVVIGFEGGDFFALIPDEIPLDERFRSDRALLTTEVGFRRTRNDSE